MQTHSKPKGPLDNVDAFIFDVFGTVVDWRTSVVKEVSELGQKYGVDPATVNWRRFAEEWRLGYGRTVHSVGAGSVTLESYNIDIIHRKLLEELVAKSEWAPYTLSWTEEDKHELTFSWHRLKGWPDSSRWLGELKRDKIIATLSNGNVRLLVDMAKHANLPWDVIFSTELFDTFKPKPKAYLEAMRHLSLPPHKCAMVAAHIHDLRAARELGMKTIYVPRPDENPGVKEGEVIKSKEEGGEVDLVVESFEGIVQLVRGE